MTKKPTKETHAFSPGTRALIQYLKGRGPKGATAPQLELPAHLPEELRAILVAFSEVPLLELGEWLFEGGSIVSGRDYVMTSSSLASLFRPDELYVIGSNVGEVTVLIGARSETRAIELVTSDTSGAVDSLPAEAFFEETYEEWLANEDEIDDRDLFKRGSRELEKLLKLMAQARKPAAAEQSAGPSAETFPFPFRGIDDIVEGWPTNSKGPYAFTAVWKDAPGPDTLSALDREIAGQLAKSLPPSTLVPETEADGRVTIVRLFPQRAAIEAAGKRLYQIPPLVAAAVREAFVNVHAQHAIDYAYAYANRGTGAWSKSSASVQSVQAYAGHADKPLPDVIRSLTLLRDLKAKDLPALLSRVRGPLRHLNLDGVKKAPLEAIAQLTELTTLELRDLGKVKLGTWLGELGKLRSLSTFDTEVHPELPDVFDRLPALSSLDLWNRLPMHVPPSFANLSQLRRLVLGPVGNLALLAGLDLEELTLAWVSTASLEAVVRAQRHLARLSLAPKEKEPLPDWIGELRALRALSLRSEIVSLPASIVKLSNLEEVQLGRPDAEDTYRLLGELPLQRVFNLEPPVGKIGVPDWMKSVSTLRSLSVVSEIDALPPWFAQFSLLESLELRAHSAAGLGGLEALRSLPALHTLDIRNYGVMKHLDLFAEMKQLRELSISTGDHFSAKDLRPARFAHLDKLALRGMSDVERKKVEKELPMVDISKW